MHGKSNANETDMRIKKPNLLVVNIEVDVEQVPQSKQQTELQSLSQATGLLFLTTDTLRHSRRSDLETVLRFRIDKRHGVWVCPSPNPYGLNFYKKQVYGLNFITLRTGQNSNLRGH